MSDSARPGPQVRHLQIDDDAGQRIDNYLKRELKGVPASRLYRMLRRGEVRVNGGRVKPTYRLRAGDSVRLPPVRTAEPSAAGAPAGILEQLEAAIVFEDADLLVLDKPAGLAVHGGSGLRYGVIEALREMRQGRLELGHRLDRDTSGCLVVAKTRRALVEVHEGLRDRSVRKHYAALVHGRWPRRRQGGRSGHPRRDA